MKNLKKETILKIRTLKKGRPGKDKCKNKHNSEQEHLKKDNSEKEEPEKGQFWKGRNWKETIRKRKHLEKSSTGKDKSEN